MILKGCRLPHSVITPQKATTIAFITPRFGLFFAHQKHVCQEDGLFFVGPQPTAKKEGVILGKILAFDEQFYERWVALVRLLFSENNFCIAG